MNYILISSLILLGIGTLMCLFIAALIVWEKYWMETLIVLLSDRMIGAFLTLTTSVGITCFVLGMVGTVISSYMLLMFG